MTRYGKRILLLLILLCSIHFWRYYRIPSTFYKLTDLFALVILGASLVLKLSSELRFKSAIIVLLIGIFFNILSAYFNNGQGIKDTMLSFGPFYFILFYFYLHWHKPEKEELEKIIIIFGFVYALFYLYQARKFPERIFIGSMFEDRGTIRIRLEGSGFLMFAYFLLLNRYLMKRKIMHVVLALFLFLVLIKSGYRTLTLGAILVSGILFIRLINTSLLNYILIVLAVFLFIGLFQLPSTSRIIDNMINTSEQQFEQSDQYIRKLQYEYFTKEYPKNISYYIVGGGLPGAYGSYSRYMRYLTSNLGYYWVDLGLIGFYFVVGGVALFGLLLFTFQAIFSKVPNEGFYLKAYFVYLLIVSITTMEIFRPGIFAIEAMGLYLIDIYSNEITLEQKTDDV